MILHDSKLIFIHIPKCAGRSIADAFNQRFDHFTARYYEDEYPYAWNQYGKFTIIRNPFARLVSVYTFVQSHRRHCNEPISGKQAPFTSVELPTFSEWVKANIEAYNSWHKWYFRFCDSAEGMRGFDGQLGTPFWFASQFQRLSTSLIGDKPEINVKIFKLEDGMFEVEKFLYNQTGKQVAIGHVNKSNDLDFHSFYDPETLALVREWEPIKEDCIKFNYKFYHDDM